MHMSSIVHVYEDVEIVIEPLGNEEGTISMKLQKRGERFPNIAILTDEVNIKRIAYEIKMYLEVHGE